MQFEFRGTFSPIKPEINTGTIFAQIAKHTDRCEVKGYRIIFSSSDPEKFDKAVAILNELTTVLFYTLVNEVSEAEVVGRDISL